MGIPSYSRRIPEFKKRIHRLKWQNENLPKWWFGVKEKAIVISEGDSWFDFPLKSLTEYLGLGLKHTIGLQGFGINDRTNIIDHLAHDPDLDIELLRIERSGDISKELIADQPDMKGGVKEREYPSATLSMVLKEEGIGEFVDLILLSAGGNDMVNHAQKHCIQRFSSNWLKSCDYTGLLDKASQIADHYVQALLLRDKYTPQAHVLTHTYCTATHTSQGTPLIFDLSTIKSLLALLVPFFSVNWLKPVFATIGFTLDDEHSIKENAHLHSIFDERGWPQNEGDQVHPERQEFINCMLNVLYEAMQSIPVKYESYTGKPLQGFNVIDIRHECQSPDYWADYIHLNSEGYKIVANRFKEYMVNLMASR